MEGNRAVAPRNFQSHIKFLVTTTSYNHFVPPQKKYQLVATLPTTEAEIGISPDVLQLRPCFKGQYQDEEVYNSRLKTKL